MRKLARRPVTLTQLDPRTRAAIERALLLGQETHSAICSRLKVDKRTVLAVRNQVAANPQPWQTTTAANLKHFVNHASARLADELGDMPVGQLTVPLAIAIDKLVMLEAAAGGAITAKPTDVSPEKLLAALQALAARPSQPIAVQVNVHSPASERGEGVPAIEASGEVMDSTTDSSEKKAIGQSSDVGHTAPLISEGGGGSESVRPPA